MGHCRPVRDVAHDLGVSESAGMMRAFWAGFGLAVLPQLALADAMAPRDPLCEVYLNVETQSGLTRIRAVEDPASVTATVDEPDESGVVVYHLHVAENDMGRVIGKQGRIAKAIRTVMRAAANRSNQKIAVEID